MAQNTINTDEGISMKVSMPKKYFYLDKIGIDMFFEQIFGSITTEITDGVGKKKKGDVGINAKLGSILKAFSPIDPNANTNIGFENSSSISIKKNIDSIGRLDVLINYLVEHKVEFYFSDISNAVNYCNAGNSAFVNIDDTFDIVQWFLPNKNPIDAINEDKAISFQYCNQNSYDESDSYFKRIDVKIPMMASLNKFYPPREYFGQTCHEAAYFRGFGGKKIKLNVIGQLNNAYEYFQIKPFAISY